MVLGLIATIIAGLSTAVSSTYSFFKDMIGKIIAILPKPLKIVLFLFMILFIGGSLSNFLFGLFTNYSCDVINGTTYVYDVTNPDALDTWNKVYFIKLYNQSRLDELGLNESELELIIKDYDIGKTTSTYGIKYLFNKLYGLFDEDNPNFNIYCYELYDVLTTDERINLSLSSSCGIDDIPEPEEIIPLITDYVIESDDIFFYPVCVSDSKGGYYPKMSFLGFDIFDFWTWFFGFVASIGIMAYYRWGDMLGVK